MRISHRRVRSAGKTGIDGTVTLRRGRRFDVVVSLFHVFGYQTSNDDLAAAFGTVREHLNADGLAIFD